LSTASILRKIDLSGKTLPRYIAVEGPIGVGKTTLTKYLGETFNYDTILERSEENPFLKRFYAREKNAALSTQLFFLFQRAQKLNALKQDDLFQTVYIADFLLAKDHLFAEVTLDEHELKLYQQVYDYVTVDSPPPDLVIYLQASTDVLISRIEKRGLTPEQSIDADYLNTLNNAYARYFHFYDEGPLLIINADDIDWENNPDDYKNLVEYMLDIKRGRHYYNPTAAML